MLHRLQPSDRVSDTVYEALRDAILGGRLAPGSKLSVPAIALQLGVSRSPVREAVLRLSEDGLAVEEPRRGAVVAQIASDALARLYEVRAALEGLAARLAAERQPRGLAGDLRRLLTEHDRAVRREDLEAHRTIDLRFHQRIRAASGNPELSALLDGLEGRVRLAMLTTSVKAGPHLALQDHIAIGEAVMAGDAELAERLARAHVERLRGALLAGC